MAVGDGLISMTPTSIAHTGTSATINADGGVDFVAVTSLSLNGVFTSDFDNYVMVAYYANQVDGNQSLKLRVGGTDTSGSDYTYQTLVGNSPPPGGQRYTSEASWGRLMHADTDWRGACTAYFYQPALAQPTAVRGLSGSGYLDVFLRDMAGTHSLSTAYDGFTIGSPGMTGNIHVFGYEE